MRRGAQALLERGEAHALSRKGGWCGLQPGSKNPQEKPNSIVAFPDAWVTTYQGTRDTIDGISTV